MVFIYSVPHNPLNLARYRLEYYYYYEPFRATGRCIALHARDTDIKSNCNLYDIDAQ